MPINGTIYVINEGDLVTLTQDVYYKNMYANKFRSYRVNKIDKTNSPYYKFSLEDEQGTVINGIIIEQLEKAW